MKRKRNELRFRVTFSINLCDNLHKSFEVWAKTKDKALKKAEKLIQQDESVHSYGLPIVEEIKSEGCVHFLVV